MKQFARVLGVSVLGALVVPLLFLQAQEPKEITITQIMNKNRKDALSSNIEVRRKAFEEFSHFSRNLKDVVEYLTSGLSSPDPTIRRLAVEALADIGPSAKFAVPRLRMMLEKEKDAELRAKAARTLAILFFEEFPDETAKTVLALSRALREDPNNNVRCRACGALAAIGPGAKDAMSLLIEVMLSDESDAELKNVARNSIFEVAGPDCFEHAPRLLELYRKGDIDELTQIAALRALGKIAAKEDEVVPLLVVALKNKDESKKRLRQAAAFSVCIMGPKGKKAVPALVEALEDTLKLNNGNLSNLRGTILNGLPMLGADAKPAIPALVAALEGCLRGNDEQSYMLRKDIFDCLGILGPNASGAAPALRKIVENLSNSAEIRGRARRSLNAIEFGKKYPR